MNLMFYTSLFTQDLTQWKPKKLEYKQDTFKNCHAPVPYWAEAENTHSAVRSYWLNKELDSSIIDKNIKFNKIKI